MSNPKKRRFKIIYFRIATVILISLLFILSYRIDIQILEGSLVGSRFAGLHLIDPFVAIETFASHLSMTTNLILGAGTICLLYIIAGGRAFCSWVCPYGLLSELSEYLHKLLIGKGIIKRRKEINLPSLKYWFLVFWLVLSFATGYLIFETVNLMAIASRMIIYGISLIGLLIFAALIIEIFFIRRFWCLYVCPVGACYGLLNKISAGKIIWQGGCDKCGECKESCYDKSLLNFVYDYDGNDTKNKYVNGTGCTLCGRCLDACPQGKLKYVNRLKNIV